MDSPMPRSSVNQDVDSYHHERKFTFKFSALEVETLLMSLDTFNVVVGNDELNSIELLNAQHVVYRSNYQHGFKFPVEYLTIAKDRYLNTHLGVLVDAIHDIYFEHVSTLKDAALSAKFPQLVELISPEFTLDDFADLLPAFIENHRPGSYE